MGQAAKSRRKKSVPATATTSTGGAIRRPVTPPATDDDEHMRFVFKQVDDQKWPLHNISKADWKRLLGKLGHLESMTFTQACQSKLASECDLSTCSNQQAKTRLMNRYNEDSAVEFRIARSESLRLWALRYGREFHIIWWDPNHEVYPDGKKNRR